jgi:hypothetical protein
MNALLSYTKEALVTLVNLLGIYDLATAMRHVVDPKKIGKIYLSIGGKEKIFLKKCLQSGIKREQKNRSPSSHLPFDAELSTFRRALHRSGIARFAYALVNQHPDLMWHIAHRLDAGRGKLLIQIAGRYPAAPRFEKFTTQLATAMTFLGEQHHA